MDFEKLARRLLGVLSTRIEWLRTEIDPAWARALGDHAFLPTQVELELVLRECFFASLLEDEQRPTRFVLSLLPDPQPSGDTSSGFIQFAKPQPLSRRVLRTMAPIAPPESALLCVRRGLSGDLEISGVHRFGRHYGRPIALSFATTQPGSIAVSFNNIRLMSVERGEVYVLDGLPFDERTLGAVLATHQIRQNGAFAHNLIVAEILLGAIGEIRNSGHGGAIWIQPAEVPFGNTNAIDGTGTLFDVVQRTEDRRRRYANGPELVGGIREAAAENLLRDAEHEAMAKSLAQMAAADGAVLMTMEPRLLGYSTFSHDHPPSRTSDVRGGQPLATLSPEELGGGRHRSAAAFCSAGEAGDRAALVVSQDGGVSLFMSISRPLPPYSWLPIGVTRIHLSSVGRGFAFR